MRSKEQAEPYLDFVGPYYAEKDPAHNLLHIVRIIQRVPLLSEGVSEEIHPERLYFLACFHGLGKQLAASQDLQEKARIFLKALGWTSEEMEEAFQSLKRHLTDPRTVEEKIVHDANYLEAVGAFGIAKAFTTGGARGQSIEETAGIFEHQYLDQIEFQTAIGKRLADERKSYTKDFLRHLKGEL